MASNYFYRYLLNPVMRGLLRSPLHGPLSKNIAILHFTGRKSGRALSTPLSYMREDDTVRLLSNQTTAWWKNFRGGPVAVEIEIGRQRHPGQASLLEGESDALRDGIVRFINAVPRDAAVYGLKLDSNKQLPPESLDGMLDELVLVEIALE